MPQFTYYYRENGLYCDNLMNMTNRVCQLGNYIKTMTMFFNWEMLTTVDYFSSFCVLKYFKLL